jgi:anti-sigma regulatory factor (Ser/Thr protein kinase)
MDGQAHRVSWSDTAQVGANPARIMPVLRAFADAHAGRPVRFLQELAWTGRTIAEQREAIRHEALINVAFAAAPVRALCSYDRGKLDPAIIRSALSTHPVLMSGGTTGPSPSYDGGAVFPGEWDRPLPRPPDEAATMLFRDDLASVRAFAASQAARSGLSPDRTLDVVLAVGEVASNTFLHTRAGGTLSVWTEDNELICQVEDSGYIADPLAGRRQPTAEDDGGHGLWLVHQVCDLVELRSEPGQTVVRLHLQLSS